jgi:hypothetical protein
MLRRVALSLGLMGIWVGSAAAQDNARADCIWDATPRPTRVAMHDALAAHRELIDVATVVPTDQFATIHANCQLPASPDAAVLIANVLRGHVLRDAGWLILWRQGVRQPQLDQSWLFVPVGNRMDFARFFSGGLQTKDDDAQILALMSQRLKLVSARGRTGLFDYAIGRSLLESVGEE